MKKLVTSPEQAAANIRKFAGEIGGSQEMQSRLSLVHDWYALKLDSAWAFGPSKFVGYRDNTIKKYLESYRANANGGETEQALETLSTEVVAGSRLEGELTRALEEFLERWGRKPRRGSQIRTVSEEETGFTIASAREIDEAILARISSNPGICGGRPCIKGTRMRISDIVDLVAAGATRDDILKDYPYIQDEDISAALSYAARAIDHRVISAA